MVAHERLSTGVTGGAVRIRPNMAESGSASTEEEQSRIAAELRRIRERVRDQEGESPVGPTAPLLAPRVPEAVKSEPEPAHPAAPTSPDASEVNASWDLRRIRPGGVRGLVARVLHWLLRPVLDAQTEFNSQQVRLDNHLLDYVSARFDHTHRYYDTVLGGHSLHMEDIDERHLILQEELVAHVHDLVKRADLVLAEAERGRMSLTFQLADLRARLADLEERLRRK